MIICHYKKTPIAWSPDAISDCINKYTEHESYLNEKFECGDIINYHNKYISPSNAKKMNINFNNIIKKPACILYHSFPEIVDNYSRIFTTNNNPYMVKQMVVGQYQATMPEYENFKIVRNIIDFYSNDYKQKPNMSNTIKIGFSPSYQRKRSFKTIARKLLGILSLELFLWQTKGYYKTIKVLNKIKKEYPNVEIDIIRDVPLKECLSRKSNCDIIIDECVTASFHRSGLEGLALGKMTICSLNQEVIDILKKTSKSSSIPFENIWIKDLENQLIKMCHYKFYFN